MGSQTCLQTAPEGVEVLSVSLVAFQAQLPWREKILLLVVYGMFFSLDILFACLLKSLILTVGP